MQTLPRGYNTLVGERGGRLSGGQRQRLAIARALLRNPRILVLDEATSALDPRTERLISDTLEHVGEGRTTIAVTHRLTSITNYDQIFVMSAGHLVERGTHDELLALDGVYAELWAEQTGGIACPTETPFDAVGALSAVSIFSDLGADELAAVASGSEPSSFPGRADSRERRNARHRAQGSPARVRARSRRPVERPRRRCSPATPSGSPRCSARETDAELVAEEPVELLVLDSDSLSALAARSIRRSPRALMGAGDEPSRTTRW